MNGEVKTINPYDENEICICNEQDTVNPYCECNSESREEQLKQIMEEHDTIRRGRRTMA